MAEQEEPITIPSYVKRTELLSRTTKESIAKELAVSRTTLYYWFKNLGLAKKKCLVTVEEQILLFNEYGWPSRYL